MFIALRGSLLLLGITAARHRGGLDSEYNRTGSNAVRLEWRVAIQEAARSVAELAADSGWRGKDDVVTVKP